MLKKENDPAILPSLVQCRHVWTSLLHNKRLLVLFIVKLHPKNQSQIQNHPINIFNQRILKPD